MEKAPPQKVKALQKFTNLTGLLAFLQDEWNVLYKSEVVENNISLFFDFPFRLMMESNDFENRSLLDFFVEFIKLIEPNESS